MYDLWDFEVFLLTLTLCYIARLLRLLALQNFHSRKYFECFNTVKLTACFQFYMSRRPIYLGINTILPGKLLPTETCTLISEQCTINCVFCITLAGAVNDVHPVQLSTVNTALHKHFKYSCLYLCFYVWLLCIVLFIQFVTQMRLTFVQ